MVRSRSRSGRIPVGLVLVVLAGLVTGLAWWSARERRSELRSPLEMPAEPAPERAEALREVLPPSAARARDALEAAAPGPAESVTLRIRTRQNYSRTSPIVPGVAFELGLGQGCDPASPALVRGTTDVQGLATVALPRQALEPATRLWARVAQPGLLRAPRHFALPLDPAVDEILLLAQPGVSLAGRVLDEGGSGVPAQVTCWFQEPPNGLTARGTTSADPDGWFDLPVVSGQGPARVLAEAGASGSGALQFEVDREHPPSAPIEVRVRGPGVLRGRVLEPSGTPAAGLPLAFVASELDQAFATEPMDFRHGYQTLLALRVDGEGRPQAAAATDLEGRFECRGLRAGRYVVRSTAGGREITLTPAPVFADGTELQLVLERPHLVVRVRDADGTLWDRVPVPDPDAPGVLQEWPAAPAVRLARLGEIVEPGLALDPVRATSVGDAAVFELQAGESVLVGLFGGAQPWRPVRVEATSGRQEIELPATAGGPPGRLEVTALGATGALQRGVEIRVEDPEDGFPLLRRWDFYSRPWPQTFALPEGRWRVVVEGSPLIDTYHGSLIEKSAYGRFETLVRIRSSERSVVRADLPEGARLHVSVQGTLPIGPEPENEYARQTAHGVVLTLRAPGRWPVPVSFESALPLGSTLDERLLLNTEALSERLPAGRWTLEAGLADGRSARTQVELIDGATTEVRLDLGTQPPVAPAR